MSNTTYVLKEKEFKPLLNLPIYTSKDLGEGKKYKPQEITSFQINSLPNGWSKIAVYIDFAISQGNLGFPGSTGRAVLTISISENAPILQNSIYNIYYDDSILGTLRMADKNDSFKNDQYKNAPGTAGSLGNVEDDLFKFYADYDYNLSSPGCSTSTDSNKPCIVDIAKNNTITIYYITTAKASIYKSNPQTMPINLVGTVKVISGGPLLINTNPPLPPGSRGPQGPQGPAGKDKSSNTALIISIVNLVIIILLLLAVGGFILF